MKSLKEDLRKEQEELREDLQIKLTEVETSVAAVRAEMQEEIKALEIKVRKAYHPELAIPSLANQCLVKRWREAPTLTSLRLQREAIVGMTKKRQLT